ncbi:Zinc finger SWIM-type [Arabidopsis thaliana x Arabidopsis arenosa]|uniref:Zinc finger SWIM-type n=1 Tax=Arabidopsis thaliana x Arabidopsis arenosa TaxID=1240361 RepID=A0A8T1Z4T7_9BRAS|nr:Zinc finger SWIM-type [Arabidopsis thaliana x Arabidopsis arenosa]
MAVVPHEEELATNPIDVEGEDRDEFHIARLAETFMEGEESIQHDVYPESDEDEDENGPPRVTNITRGDGSLYDKDKIGFKCVGSEKCEWQVYAASLPRDPMWTIRLIKDVHVCIPNGECEMFKVPVIARLFVDKIRDNPDYYLPAKIEEIILENWKISVTRPQCQSARRKALQWIELEYDMQFSRLRDYGAEILDANKDSVVVIDTVTSEDGKELFNRFYVCFDVLRRTWKDSCRPILGVDGCFLKHKIKGQLLVALGRDADNAIYPIAWSVVQVENTENWLWFVQRLKIDLGLNDGDGFIMISDRQKGLIRAVELELPKIEHRMCVRHIYANLKKNHASKKQMKPLIWNLAWSYNEAQFKQRLERIFAYDTVVYDEVMKSNPRRWCRAFYKIGNYCEDVDNNFTESFNKTINKAREKPFVAMLEMVRRLAMIRIAKRLDLAYSHKGICTPYVKKFLAKEHKIAAACKVSSSTNGMFEVRVSGDTHRVSLKKYTCTCMKYQICGIPCEHAYGVILNKKLTPEDYVCQWFRTNMWKRNYAEGIVPQRGARFWPISEGGSVDVPPDPAQTGRKKITKADKKRKKGVNESPTKKKPKQKKRIMHCRVCGSAEHNSRFHKKQNQPQAAQVDPSQGCITQEN